MKIKSNTDLLLSAIGQCASVVNSKTPVPILGDILFETIEDGHGGFALKMTASDSETWLSVRTPLLEGESDIRICIAAADIHKALSNLKGEVVEMMINEEKHVITCKYTNGRFQLPFEKADEFPDMVTIDDTETRTIDGAHVLCAINRTGFATANDELRPLLNGIHFDFFNDGMVSVATDGHKLVKYRNNAVSSVSQTEEEGFTLPKKPANIITNLLSGYDGKLRLRFNERTVMAYTSDFVLTTRLIEGRYPKYDSVIPKDNDIVVTIPKSAFVSALKRVLPMSNTSSELISMKIGNDELTLEAVDLDFSKFATEAIECNCTAQELTIGFKGSALLTIAQNIDCEYMTASMKDATHAVLFTPSDNGETTEYVSLLMPMLIQ